ncbi:hypothetical protein [Desulfopila inferna]|uniref:hypothetical protein n=1 Tax=Desulfopila inferna TaxID=468528 RepID=UPI001964B604|nr:hypothetical protein [Desulfopila inferna]MBM9604649.1 hypothetical protein [Desulfopila inferna]
MEQEQNLPFIEKVMDRFAEETGLQGTRPPQRYLWTDAFAVCNYLELQRRTGKDEYGARALRLVDQVHKVLGRHREDDPRNGWISGLAEAEGEKHPTRGGLRIGKELPERLADEGEDSSLEWERDGQYFHYLTKWMQALHRVSLQMKEPLYDAWALEMAEVAHDAFTYEPPFGETKRMYWKMSIDLSRPLVTSMGQHDPIDGYLSYLELQVGAPAALKKEIADLEAMCRHMNWITDDPLGIGGILADALFLIKLTASGKPVLPGLTEDLLKAAAQGLTHYSAQNPLRLPVEFRLAFRELGLAIGLRAVGRINTYLSEFEKFPKNSFVQLLDELSGYQSLRDTAEECWLAPENRETYTWESHNNINYIMLCTALSPGGFFGD